MLYRLYTPEDFDQLYAIEEVCFQPPFRFGRRYMRHLVMCPDAATWVAEESGQLAGFAIVERTQEPGQPMAYIQTIEVMPGHRGQGIGAELMRRIEASARAMGAQTIRLHVDAENAGAIRIYQAQGYLFEGREENYYPWGRDALAYEKPLESGPRT